MIKNLLLISVVTFFCLAAIASAEEAGDAWMNLQWGMSINEVQSVLQKEIQKSSHPQARHSHQIGGWRIINQPFSVGLDFKEKNGLDFITLTLIAEDGVKEIFENIAESLDAKYGERKVVDKSSEGVFYKARVQLQSATPAV